MQPNRVSNCAVRPMNQLKCASKPNNCSANRWSRVDPYVDRESYLSPKSLHVSTNSPQSIYCHHSMRPWRLYHLIDAKWSSFRWDGCCYCCRSQWLSVRVLCSRNHVESDGFSHRRNLCDRCCHAEWDLWHQWNRAAGKCCCRNSNVENLHWNCRVCSVSFVRCCLSAPMPCDCWHCCPFCEECPSRSYRDDSVVSMRCHCLFGINNCWPHHCCHCDAAVVWIRGCRGGWANCSDAMAHWRAWYRATMTETLMDAQSLWTNLDSTSIVSFGAKIEISN